MLFIIDTNTLVSAILKPDSPPSKALSKALKLGTLLFSPETQQELQTVLQRPKFDRFIPIALREEKINEIFSRAKVFTSTTNQNIECRDSTDIKFLRLAFEAQADCIVSGDNDLLTLHPFEGIPIMNASVFLSSF